MARRWQKHGNRNMDCGLRRNRRVTRNWGPTGKPGSKAFARIGALETSIRRNMREFSFRVTFICAALLLTAPVILSAQNSPNPIATLDGHPIYEEELMSVAGPSLLELRNQEYKVKSDALDKLVRKKLIEA